MALVALLAISTGSASLAGAASKVSITVREDEGQAYVVVHGGAVRECLAPAGAARPLNTSDWTLQQWHAVLRVSVDSQSGNSDSANGDSGAVDSGNGKSANGKTGNGKLGKGESKRRPLPIFGTYQLVNSEIHFRPRFKFRPGVAYRATFFPARFTAVENLAEPVEHGFTLVKAATNRSTFVQAVYPTADVLPENLLKLYVRFSAPMRQAVALEYVRLTRADGTLVKDAFVNVGQELWDRSGEQLTLLFDPGRIKHGLRPRQELGPVLQQGADYVLRIDAAWKDADGRTLARSFQKKFSVAAPDMQPPVPANWHIHAPAAGTTSPLEIAFHEPLDYALAQHSIQIVSPRGSPVVGEVALVRQEQNWRFAPKSAWLPGQYSIVIDGRLEDLAAHSVGRPFEVIVDRDQKTPPVADAITLSLSID